MSAPRWKVFKNGNSIGLMSAAEIRQALKDGELDPFDSVSRDGSQIKVEIVEVDEIFNEISEDQDTQGEGSTQIATVPHKALPNQQSIEFEKDSTIISVPSYHYYQQPKDSAPQAEASIKPRRRSKPRQNFKTKIESTLIIQRKKAKKFYLLDKRNNKLGPLSAGEIQSLYLRGIIEKTTSVQKIGNLKSIPIKTFLSVYSGERVRELATTQTHTAVALNKSQQLGTPSHRPNSAVLSELSRGVLIQRENNKNLPYITMMLFGIILGMLAFLIMTLSYNDRQPFNTYRYEKSNSKQSKKEKSKYRSKKEERATTSKTRKKKKVYKPTKKTTKRYSLQQTNLKNKNRYKRTVRSFNKYQRVRKNTPKRITNTRSAHRKTTRSRVVIKPTTKKTQPPKRYPSSRIARTPVARPKVSGAGFQKLRSSVGRVITTDPVYFSKTQLNKCPLKCKLYFRYSTGQTILAVFFKGAYLDKLNRSPGMVRLKGLIKKSGSNYTIFLQGVQ